MKNIKGILFDLGGTILSDLDIDFSRGIEAIYNHLVEKNVNFTTFLKYANDLKEDTFKARTTFDFKFKDFANLLLNYFEDSFDTDMSIIESIFHDSMFNNFLVSDIVPFLDKLKKENYKLGIVSNTIFSEEEIKKVLRNYNVLHYFDFVISSSDVLVRKPSKFIFDLAIKKMNLTNDEVIYIGNDPTLDINGCENIGIPIMFLNKYNYKCSNYKTKVYEFQSYKELMGLDICQIF